MCTTMLPRQPDLSLRSPDLVASTPVQNAAIHCSCICRMRHANEIVPSLVCMRLQTDEPLGCRGWRVSPPGGGGLTCMAKGDITMANVSGAPRPPVVYLPIYQSAICLPTPQIDSAD